MSQGFDLSELQKYAKDLATVGQEYEKAERRFLQKEGAKLRSKTKAQARKLGKKTGNYLKSIKRGKVYEYDGAQAVRVYSTAPHAHLIEDGHRMVSHDGRELGFVPGMHIFEVSGKDFQPEFLADIDEMLDEVVKEL